MRQGTRSGDDPRTRVSQGRDHCCTNAPGTARHQCAPPLEVHLEAHGVISSELILPRSSVKANRRSTGLPGKLPVTRTVTR